MMKGGSKETYSCEHSGIRYLNKRTQIEIPLIFDGNQGGVFSCCNSSLLERYVLPAWFTLPILSLVGSSAWIINMILMEFY
ncbi:hypothetical protein AAC387_Pa07g3234 [Persea americana]